MSEKVKEFVEDVVNLLNHLEGIMDSDLAVEAKIDTTLWNKVSMGAATLRKEE